MEFCWVYRPGIWIAQRGFPASKGPVIREFCAVYYDDDAPSPRYMRERATWSGRVLRSEYLWAWRSAATAPLETAREPSVSQF